MYFIYKISIFYFHFLLQINSFQQFVIPRLNLPFMDNSRFYLNSPPSSPIYPPKTFTLCEYWQILGVYREECHPSMINDDYESNQNQNSFLSISTCQLKYISASCVKSTKCQSGNLCLDYKSQKCCQPMSGTCPTPSQLGYKCLVYTPINWCKTDEDCKEKKCCPTGCNYNVCI